MPHLYPTGIGVNPTIRYCNILDFIRVRKGEELSSKKKGGEVIILIFVKTLDGEGR